MLSSEKATILASIGLSFALAAFPAPAATLPCGPSERVHELAQGRGEPFVSLSPEQWEFVRGIYLMDPNTPPGLPPGDGAEMSRREDGSATIVFLDGPLACSPMHLLKDGVDILNQVGRGEIVHAEGKL